MAPAVKVVSERVYIVLEVNKKKVIHLTPREADDLADRLKIASKNRIK